MSSLVITRRVISERRRWSLAWSLGVVGLVLLTVAFWPAIRDKSADLSAMIDKLPESVKSLMGMGGGVDPFSAIGYLSSKVYAFMLPMLLLIAGIGLAAAVAGEEEHGLLETAYALPIARRRLVLERWLAVMALTGLLGAVTFVAIAGVARIVQLDVGLSALWWSTVGATLLAWSYAAIALAAGAWSGRRSVAISVSAVLAVAGYLVASLADAGIGAFQSIRSLSLFTHYDVLHSLQFGSPPWSLLVLAAVAAAGVGFALWAIDRRDLRAG